MKLSLKNASAETRKALEAKADKLAYDYDRFGGVDWTLFHIYQLLSGHESEYDIRSSEVADKCNGAIKELAEEFPEIIQP